MPESNSLSLYQRIAKHSLLWIVFAYCYNSVVNLLFRMAADAQPNDVFVTSSLYCLCFNVLSAHLITKYDNYWPVVAASVIGIVGLVLIPIILSGITALLSIELLAVILISLPLFTYLMRLIKLKLVKN